MVWFPIGEHILGDVGTYGSGTVGEEGREQDEAGRGVGVAGDWMI